MKGRQPKLTDLEAHFLRIRMEIAEETRLIAPNEVASSFSIHMNTVRRYIHPEEREYSRELSKRKHWAYKLYLQSCFECKQTIAGHNRCVSCTMLIHQERYECRCGRAHSYTPDNKHCLSCYEDIHKVHV